MTHHVMENVYLYMESTMQEEFEDTKWVIIIQISKENRQHNGQKKKYKGTNNDLQNTHKTNDRVTRSHPHSLSLVTHVVKIVNYEMVLILSPFTSTFDSSTHHPVI